jgi:cytochrome b6-f complex iron-sulfur subunit
MNRKDFLSALGLGTAAVACSYCLNGCKPLDSPITAPTNVDFTLDLTASTNAALKTNGGYLYNGGIIIARTANSSYVALSQICTHAGGTVQYVVSSNSFYCPNHGSNFATNGSVINGPATSPLTAYHTSLNGSSLRVYS